MYGFADDWDDDDKYDYDSSEEAKATNDEFFLVERGPVSTVRKTLIAGFGRQGEDLSVRRWIAVKTSTTNPKFSKQPHDIIKEVRLLSSLSHVNIIILFDYIDDQPYYTMHLYMPFIPYSFDRILESPSFSPFPSSSISLNHTSQSLSTFYSLVLSKSLTLQIVSAIAYLHSPLHHIAHRDIKPRNILITEEGYVKLIDFGVSFKSDETEQDQENDLWPETKEDMCTAVSTGPYRAPELLFGAKSYNAFSADLWSLGTTLAEFFTPLALVPSSPSSSDDEDAERHGQPDEQDAELPPFIVPPSISIADAENEYNWIRTSLFNGTRGELGLIWSIFKTMGTPTETSWPGYKDLLSPTSIAFRHVPGVPLRSRLPNLPPQSSPFSASRTHALDFISRLIVYPPEDRLTAQDALSHSWLTSSNQVPLLLPPDYALRPEQEHLKSQIVWDLDGKSLGDLVKEVLESHMEENQQ